MIEFERCRIRHIHAIAKALRDEHRQEIAAVNVKPRHVMLACYRLTPEPWACITREGVMAVWGDAAPVMARIGYAWVFTSPLIEKVPLFFFREVRRQVRKMLETRDVVISDIGAGCEKALRFYKMIGFSISQEMDGFHRISIS
jgi:hypothetical protein